jgi:hypothetical protein
MDKQRLKELKKLGIIFALLFSLLVIVFSNI